MKPTLYTMKNIFLLFSLFFFLLSFGQANSGYALVDTKMAAIPANATTSTQAIANYINAILKQKQIKSGRFFIGRHQLSAMMLLICFP